MVAHKSESPAATGQFADLTTRNTAIIHESPDDVKRLVNRQAVQAAQRRLLRATQFLEMNARRPLFEKIMRLDGGRRVKVGLYLPGPVLIQFDPATGEIFARSKPGQLDQLDEGFLAQ